MIADVNLIENKSCINRNILECKCMFAACKAVACCVLIETYWNVKTSKVHIDAGFSGASVLIETYWNVKG